MDPPLPEVSHHCTPEEQMPLKQALTLSRWLSWSIAIHQKIAGSILGQGTCLGCWFISG